MEYRDGFEKYWSLWEASCYWLCQLMAFSHVGRTRFPRVRLLSSVTLRRSNLSSREGQSAQKLQALFDLDITQGYAGQSLYARSTSTVILGRIPGRWSWRRVRLNGVIEVSMHRFILLAHMSRSHLRRR